MQLIATMDPTNPRWETSEARTKRSATMWKIIVAAAGTSALTAMMVVSCLDRDVARRNAQEPAFVETTSATATATPGATPAAIPQQAAPVAAAPAAATRDSTGGVADDTAGTTSTTSATTTTTTTTVTSAPAATQVPARQLNYTPAAAPFQSVNGDTSTSGTNGTANGGNGATDAASSATDGGTTRNDDARRAEDPNRGSNPQSPSFSAGAGGFVTEAPYWGASAWTSDPNAGAGPFTTERNTPAYGSEGVVRAPAPGR